MKIILSHQGLIRTGGCPFENQSFIRRKLEAIFDTWRTSPGSIRCISRVGFAQRIVEEVSLPPTPTLCLQVCSVQFAWFPVQQGRGYNCRAVFELVHWNGFLLPLIYTVPVTLLPNFNIEFSFTLIYFT